MLEHAENFAAVTEIGNLGRQEGSSKQHPHEHAYQTSGGTRSGTVPMDLYPLETLDVGQIGLKVSQHRSASSTPYVFRQGNPSVHHTS